MAFGMIHYVISKRVAELVGIEDVERFLLGAVVAPDASSHADGSYDKAHFQGWLQDRTMKGIDFNRFADKCVRICAEEIEKRKTGKENIQAEQYYVKA